MNFNEGIETTYNELRDITPRRVGIVEFEYESIYPSYGTDGSKKISFVAPVRPSRRVLHSVWCLRLDSNCALYTDGAPVDSMASISRPHRVHSL